MTTTLSRVDIQKISNDPKVILALESLFRTVANTSSAVSSGADATTGQGGAAVVMLSANDYFTNGRILEVAPPLALTDDGPGSPIIIGFSFPFAISGGFALSLNLFADTILNLPTSGTLQTTDYQYPGPFANDADAATGGVPVNGLYLKTGGSVAWRQV